MRDNYLYRDKKTGNLVIYCSGQIIFLVDGSNKGPVKMDKIDRANAFFDVGDYTSRDLEELFDVSEVMYRFALSIHWIKNTGTKPSLDDTTYVEVEFRNGLTDRGAVNVFNWDIYNTQSDILKYKVLN